MMRTGVAKLVTPFPIFIILIASQYLRKLMLCPPDALIIARGFRTPRLTNGCTIRPKLRFGCKVVTSDSRFIAARQPGELLLQVDDLPFELCRVEVRMDLHQFLLIGSC